MTKGAPKSSGIVKFLRVLVTRVLPGFTVLCVAAISIGCSGGVNRPAGPNAYQTTTLVISKPIDHVDLKAREPMIIEHPDGTLFVSGYGESTPMLWKSSDRGASWTQVNVGTESDGAVGNSDVDLAVARDGTLYFVTMFFDRKTNEGTQISAGVSKDLGSSWSWTLLSKSRFDDRPWVEVSRDGTAHVIWNDGSGVSHAVTEDGGATWNERPRIHTQGGSSHLAVGPNREVAARITPLSASGNKYDEGVDLVAVSSDGGLTWQKQAAPGQREWSPMLDTMASPPRWLEPKHPRWVEPLAWDDQGALYSLWTNREGLWLGQSVNQGATWTTWRVVESSDLLFFPYLIARGRGQLAGTWFSSGAETLQAHAALFELRDGDTSPRVTESPAVQIDSWTSGKTPEDPPIRDAAGEYLALTFLKDGALAMVSPIQNRRDNRFGFSFWRIEGR